ncbi:hypothetical protein SH584_10470 [Sphingomonas sp. LY29]|uniref:hypothetical protein n=1 Tax=Sphingomonas sp. LY29 TaxID=3095341 RepID=UPI002D794B34|nr:hypothetical protein [Sphingomonas sp. LY29]WRP25465.1 hypothetical protein SH584_10470 [Sphingomonas sp. LY29]
MNEALRDAGVSGQIVVTAYLALIAAGLVLAVGSTLIGRIVGKKTRIPDPFEALIGIGVVIGIPGAFAAAAALFVTPLLLAMPLPLAGWLLIAAFSLFGFWGSESSGGEMGGCTKMIGISLSAYGLLWAGTAILLAHPQAGDFGTFLRPILIAAPLGIFLGKQSRGKKAKQTIGFTLLFALLIAVAFLPVEDGFAANLLPTSDWLRFPIAGAVAFGIWPIVTIPLARLLGKRLVKWKERWRTSLALGLVGAAFGLAWAGLRALFAYL